MGSGDWNVAETDSEAYQRRDGSVCVIVILLVRLKSDSENADAEGPALKEQSSWWLWTRCRDVWTPVWLVSMEVRDMEPTGPHT